MRKGITPIIAIIVLLLITVALAGTAWTYLSSYMTGLTGNSYEVSDYFCTVNEDIIVIVQNFGTLPLDLNEIIVYDKAGNVVGNANSWRYPENVTVWPISDRVDVNSRIKWLLTDAGAGTHTLRFTGGSTRTQIVSVSC